MEKFYCKYCGRDFNSISNMTARPCPNHPNGSNKGRHEPYEGDEKDVYYCKYCGRDFNSISNMTARPCPNHPNGSNKGRHEPSR